MDQEIASIELWREKLEHLRSQEAIAADGAQKFALRKQIEEAQARIAELARQQAGGGPDAAEIQVVPKGLRAFDEGDQGFFLRLLPGPYRDDGLPQSVYFWKRRIEEPDADKTFRVGVISGPSGCGKSSFVKAGLIPHLVDTVTVAYVQATFDGTESALVTELNKRVPGLGDGSKLRPAIHHVTQAASGQKLLLVIDQFEQYLHGKREEDYSELADALRECDGSQTQCMLLIREDFWTPLRRFLDQLEVRLDEERNLAWIDTFKQSHARDVLALFGQAYDNSLNPLRLTGEQEAFVEQAVKSLAGKDGRVICVRLALFADMIAQMEAAWKPSTLKQLSWTELGVKFLDVTLGGKPIYRDYQKPAEAVLRELLPEVGVGIKGAMRSKAHLLAKSGYAKNPQEMETLLDILVHRLRLISPTLKEPTEGQETPEAGQPHYQLTHDYLVPSLREWLLRKQTETRQGRARIRLAERAALWSDKPENRRLPSLPEYLNIRLLTKSKDWAEPEREMMARAARVLGLRWGIALIVVFALGFVGNEIKFGLDGTRVVNELVSADASEVSDVLPRLKSLRRHVLPILKVRFRSEDVPDIHRLHAAHGLATLGQVEYAYLVSSILRWPDEFDNILSSLDTTVDRPLELLAEEARACETRARKGETADAWRQKAILAITALYFGDSSIAQDMLEVRRDPKQETVDPIQRTVFIDEFPARQRNPAGALRVVQGSDNQQLRSGIVLALGRVPLEDLGDGRQECVDVLSEWYKTKPDAGTHSAAVWALRQWQPDAALPKLPNSKHAPDGQDWYVNPAGVTMLRIPAGQFRRETQSGFQTVKLSDFWLSDREVSVGLFQEFMDDAKYHQKHSGEKPEHQPTPEPNISPSKWHPVQGVNWFDAAMFCNWLTRRGGREEDVCYQRTGKVTGSDGKEYTVWEEIKGATGYRLPTEAQWEYACRGGTSADYAFATTTDFSFGNDYETFLGFYGVAGVSRTEKCGSRLCNTWGLFDMHGNVWEWCQDWWSSEYPAEVPPNPTGPPEASIRVVRGGGWWSGAGSCRSAYRYRDEPECRYDHLGFRVAAVPPSQSSQEQDKHKPVGEAEPGA